jgi:hypothetical protein
MSRYQLPKKQHVDPRQTIVYGWDNVLKTYFFEVYDGKKIIFTLGQEGNLITDIEEFIRILSRYADVTESEQIQLEKDKS